MSSAEAREAFLSIFEGSLSRLQTDYVDILYFHDVSTAEDIDHPGVMEAMKKAGKGPFQSFLESQTVRTAAGYCRQCGRCVASCPNSINIPALMRAHMYAVGYGNLQESVFTLAGLPSGRGLDGCLNCSSCRVFCPNRLPVASRLADLRDFFKA
jgi:predicted aldo/keto reductase-like oxidoreductase